MIYTNGSRFLQRLQPLQTVVYWNSRPLLGLVVTNSSPHDAPCVEVSVRGRPHSIFITTVFLLVVPSRIPPPKRETKMSDQLFLRKRLQRIRKYIGSKNLYNLLEPIVTSPVSVDPRVHRARTSTAHYKLEVIKKKRSRTWLYRFCSGRVGIGR